MTAPGPAHFLIAAATLAAFAGCEGTETTPVELAAIGAESPPATSDAPSKNEREQKQPAGEKQVKQPPKLPGANGPLFKYIGKAGPKVLGADVAVGISDCRPDQPPRHRILPARIKKVYVAVKFERRPRGKTLSVEIHNNSGPVKTGGGAFVTIQNHATGAWTMKTGRPATSGQYSEGAHQGLVKIDGEAVALINWEVRPSQPAESQTKAGNPAATRTGVEALKAGNQTLVHRIQGTWRQTDDEKNRLSISSFENKQSGRVIITTRGRVEACFYDVIADDKIKLTSAGSPVWKFALVDGQLTVIGPDGARRSFKRVAK